MLIQRVRVALSLLELQQGLKQAVSLLHHAKGTPKRKHLEGKICLTECLEQYPILMHDHADLYDRPLLMVVAKEGSIIGCIDLSGQPQE